MTKIGTFTKDGSVTIQIGNKFITIPADDNNADWIKVVARLAAGDTIDPYTEPVVDTSAADDAEINALLLQPGSVVRALATVVFKDMKTRTPSLTIAQFKALLKAEMR